MRLANKQMFKQHVKHYYQCLRSTIHIKTKTSQSSHDSVIIQGPSKRSSSGLLHPVSSVKEHNRKGGKCKSLGFYSLLFLVPKPHQWWRSVIGLGRLNTFLLIERFKMETSESIRPLSFQGMGVIHRFVGHLPSHRHPPKLKEVSKALQQVSGVSVHLPSI